MTDKEVRVGLQVYHSVFHHRGKGTVIDFRRMDQNKFPVRTNWKVRWSHGELITTWERAHVLLKEAPSVKS